MVAGGASGAAIASLGLIAPLNVRLVVGIILAWTVACAALLLPRRLPQIDRETEQSLLGHGPLEWATLNGALLGLGFTSRVGYWIWYLVPITCFILGAPVIGAIVWATYALTRLGIAVSLAGWMHHHPDQISQISRWLLALRPRARGIVGPAAGILAFALGIWLAY